jgi:hydroxymethylbilane synthase
LEGDYDATILAATGLARLDLTYAITEWLPLSVMLPAPGQGALAVQYRANDDSIRSYLAAIDNASIRRAAQTERAFLSRLGSGCSAPVGAYACVLPDGRLHLEVLVASPDGSHVVRHNGTGSDDSLAARLAEEALEKGARKILLKVEEPATSIPSVQALNGMKG